jgi:hypothetical protein
LGFFFVSGATGRAETIKVSILRSGFEPLRIKQISYTSVNVKESVRFGNDGKQAGSFEVLGSMKRV